MQCGKRLTVKFSNASKMNVVHEICEKHLGKNKLFIHATLDDVEQMRLICHDLGSAVKEMNLNEIIANLSNPLTNEAEPIPPQLI